MHYFKSHAQSKFPRFVTGLIPTKVEVTKSRYFRLACPQYSVYKKRLLFEVMSTVQAGGTGFLYTLAVQGGN